MKKWLQVLFASSLVLSLAACSDDTESVEEKEEVEQEAVQEEKQEAEDVELAEESEQEDVEEAEQEDKTGLPAEDLSEEKGILAEDNLQSIIEEYALGASDQLEDFSYEDGVVYYKVSLGEHDTLTPEMLAELMYSRLGDEILKYEGWDTLTVEFVDLGKTVSFDYDEHEENEYNLKYFPSLEINERLK